MQSYRELTKLIMESGYQDCLHLISVKVSKDKFEKYSNFYDNLSREVEMKLLRNKAKGKDHGI